MQTVIEYVLCYSTAFFLGAIFGVAVTTWIVFSLTGEQK